MSCVSFVCLACVVDVVVAEVMLVVMTKRDSDLSLLTSSVIFLTAAALSAYRLTWSPQIASLNLCIGACISSFLWRLTWFRSDCKLAAVISIRPPI